MFVYRPLASPDLARSQPSADTLPGSSARTCRLTADSLFQGLRTGLRKSGILLQGRRSPQCRSRVRYGRSRGDQSRLHMVRRVHMSLVGRMVLSDGGGVLELDNHIFCRTLCTCVERRKYRCFRRDVGTLDGVGVCCHNGGACGLVPIHHQLRPTFTFTAIPALVTPAASGMSELHSARRFKELLCLQDHEVDEVG